jgi:hypothetical protein
LVKVDRHPALSSCAMLVRPLLNFSSPSYTLLYSTALSLYCVESLQWISVPDTRSNQRNQITALCSSSVHAASRGTMFTLSHQQGCAEGSVTNLKMCYGESADNFWLYEIPVYSFSCNSS